MKNRVSLKTKLLSVFLAVGIIPFALISVIAYINSSTALKEEAFSKLDAIQELKAEQIDSYLESARIGMEQFAGSKDVEYLYTELVKYHNDMHTSPTGSYDVSTDRYKEIWSKYGHRIEKYRNSSGFDDIAMVCAAHSHVMYTVEKEGDLGINLRHGEFRNTGLQEVLEEVIETGSAAFSDYRPYEPHENEIASFIAAPIKHPETGKLIGVMAVQLSIDEINKIMGSRAGLGETGETYLVGEDNLMRSDSYLDPVNHTVKASFKDPSKGSIRGSSVTNALNGESGRDIIIDYNGNPVLSVFSPLKFLGHTWAVIAEIDVAEAFSSSKNLLTTIIIILIIGLIVITVVAIIITNSISNPISRVAEQIASGSGQVSSASVELQASSLSLSQGATEQASSLEEISSSLEEMSSMTKASADNARKAESLMESTEHSVEDGKNAITELSTAINEIKENSDKTAKIIKDIDEIAFQTNLLALNAAVEAARAGDHGKGFAVVAEEVRNLAQRSADAAKDTAALINTAKESAQNGVNLTDITSETIDKIIEGSQKVSALVREIAAAATEQATGIEQINEGTLQLDKVTQGNAANSEETASASEELTSQSQVLTSMVSELRSILTGKLNAESTTTYRAPQRSQPQTSVHLSRTLSSPRTQTIAPKIQSAKELLPFDEDSYGEY